MHFSRLYRCGKEMVFGGKRPGSGVIVVCHCFYKPNSTDVN